MNKLLTTFVGQIVDTSQTWAKTLVAACLILTILLGLFAVDNFKINTDVNQLLAEDLPWRHQEKVLEKAFPQNVDTLLVVIDGDTPDHAEEAATLLYSKLLALPATFKSVTRPDAIPFFRKNGLLFLSEKELGTTLDALVQAQPMLGTLVSDPSLRGFFSTIGMMAQGVAVGMIDKNSLERPLNAIASTLEAAQMGENQPMGWQDLMASDKPTLRDLRKYILTLPNLDYSQLEPGHNARGALQKLIQENNLTPNHGVHIRLTGSIPLADEEFASVANDTGLATALSGALVVIILFLALRSWRLIIPILLTLLAGLTATTAFALFTVGSLNLISVAFAVMFIGIAVDFGIQFGVRYRDQHHLESEHIKAMHRTASIIAVPLAMAAGSTALGFFAFTPTAYRGVSELGLIAGAGMVIAFLFNISLLPALLTLFKPPAEPEAIGYLWAAPFDRWLEKNRTRVLVTSIILGLVSLGLITQLRFDFDPLNLKDPRTESVSTLFDLMKDPDFSFYKIDILRPSLREADTLGLKIGQLPEVDHVMTLSSFVPDNQSKKLGLISDANMVLQSTFSLPTSTPPSDDEVIGILKQSADNFRTMTQSQGAQRLVKDMDQIITQHDHALLQRLNRNLVEALMTRLKQIQEALTASVVDASNITPDLKRDWVTTDDQYLIEVYPKGNPRDHKVLRAFTKAVRTLAPDSSGSPISIQESAHTVTNAFIEAGFFALLAIALLSTIVLKSFRDSIILLAPLILAGLLTLATIVIIDIPLNFANIIALPLLLSLGVSYSIYFVFYAQSGSKNPLQSSVARAVFFSASTTFVAFGTLSLSSHPGTSGMGKLLTVALLYTVLCTFFVLPALLGLRKNDKG